jgi:AraC family transcriptional activator FtrA
VRVNADVLYLDAGSVLTSAGTAAGIDLCLHLVRRDHGAEVANRVARRMVVAAHRDGGQAQFVERPVARAERDDPVGRAMEHALAKLGEPLSVAELARSAHLSPRQLERRFHAATGTSPGRWLIAQRVQASLPMLEAGAESVEQVAAAVGFTPAGYRRHFRSRLGISPAAYRQRFRAERAA